MSNMKPVAPSSGGNGRLMFVGMATVMSGLVGFYFLQFRTQGLRDSAKDMPTWQFRHAQQDPNFNNTATGGSLQHQGTPEYKGHPKAVPTSNRNGGGGDLYEETPGQAATKGVMTKVQGVGTEETQNSRAHESEPASRPENRRNDYGVYTKHPDYKDGNK
ncbi:hypothetical protein CERSUDRAFT_96614 [Gelatoporia subvermispora B]|uniref:Uncharacterized protein n=1 Tax=Ceriporiopsis subvermispora (strain B) TaxID=914234 RepID=M2QEM1_CERS8|nr:hypothetical protein CERSUDRAFT_96614 [Gelatoporia subvermispora B]